MKNQIDLDEPIPMLPPFEVTACVSILSEVKDYAHEMCNIPEMWKSTKGAGVKVVVLDTGVAEHPDLQLAGTADFTRSGATDRNGHGTHCAGIIGAIADNGMGIAGIAPECEMYAGKVLGDNGSGSFRDVAAGIRWAVDTVKADVINLSLGVPAGFPEVSEMRKACDYALERGVMIVGAAGNDAGLVGQPACYDSVMAVAAVDNQKQHARFSNKGKQVEFAAAGVDVYSTYLRRSYAKLSGTSMASPAIAGLVALVIADAKKDGEVITPYVVKQKLLRIAFDVGPTGFDEMYGHGIPVFRPKALDPNRDNPEKPIVEDKQKIEDMRRFWGIVFSRIRHVFAPIK